MSGLIMNLIGLFISNRLVILFGFSSDSLDSSTELRTSLDEDSSECLSTWFLCLLS